ARGFSRRTLLCTFYGVCDVRRARPVPRGRGLLHQTIFEARFLDFGLGRKLGDRLARDRRIERRSRGKRVLGLLRAVLLRPNERAQIDPVLLVDALEDRVAGMAALLLPERQILSFAAHRFDRTADRFDLRTEEPLDLLERMVALLLDPQ